MLSAIDYPHAGQCKIAAGCFSNFFAMFRRGCLQEF
jgi:hypothetical protein